MADHGKGGTSERREGNTAGFEAADCYLLARELGMCSLALAFSLKRNEGERKEA